MTLEPERFLPLKGCLNFRDLGGYRAGDGRTVRWRRLFRSDAIHPMTSEDAEYVFNELGVTTIVDLRNSSEIHRDGRQPTATPATRYHNAAFLEQLGTVPFDPSEDPSERLAGMYHWILQNSGHLIAGAFDTLAEADSLPAVFHCTAGKDRSGILAAVILGALGMDDKVILEDCALTNKRLDQLFLRLRAIPGSEQRPIQAFAARPRAMQQLLSEIRGNYANAVGYLQAHGVAETTVDRLRGSLLE